MKGLSGSAPKKALAWTAGALFAAGGVSYVVETNGPSVGETALSAVEPEKVDVWINGGGFPAFWWGYGFTAGLLQGGRRARSLSGYSAGALVSTLVSCGVEVEVTAAAAEVLLADCRVGNLGHTVRAFCDRVLPDDCHRRLMEHQVSVVMCNPAHMGQVKLVRAWTCKRDVVDSLVASCFVPGAMDGPLAWTDPVHGCIDGWFGTDLATHRAASSPEVFVVSYTVPTLSLDTLLGLSALDLRSALDMYGEGYAAGRAAQARETLHGSEKGAGSDTEAAGNRSKISLGR